MHAVGEMAVHSSWELASRADDREADIEQGKVPR
jgi:hypothetical protein